MKRFVLFELDKHTEYLDKPIAPANDAPPPWVKEIEKKKSSFTREDIKPESGSVKKEPATSPTPKPVRRSRKLKCFFASFLNSVSVFIFLQKLLI